MCVNLGSLNARVPEQLLHGADVVARLDHVRGEGVSEGVTAPRLRHHGRPDRTLHGLLERRLGYVVAPLAPTSWVYRPVASREDVLPAPLTVRVRIFSGQGVGQVDAPEPLVQIQFVQRPRPL